MRFFQLSFLLGLIAIVCALPLGQHENQHGKKLQRRFLLGQAKFMAGYYAAMGIARGLFAGSAADVCRIRGWKDNTPWDDRTIRQMEDADTNDSLYGHCNPDIEGLTF